MSGSVSGVTEYGLRGQLIGDSAAARRQVNLLTQQSASGDLSDSYSGLGDGARVSLDLSPQIERQKAISKGIGQAAGRLGVTQTALSGITQIAQKLYGQLSSLNGLNQSEVDSVAAQARSALVQAAGLLDSSDGGTYVFAGKDGSNPPVPSPDSILTSGFYTQINAAVSALGTNGASATAASTLAVASSDAAGTTPFSSYLSAASAASLDVRPTTETGDGAREASGVAANANGDVRSGGASTTGSYTRDILRALATIGSLTSAQAGDAGFQGLIQDTRASLGDAITAIGADSGALGDRQTRLTGIATAADATATALKAQVSDAQDADLARVSTELSQAQTQLQASYQLIAQLNKLSLVQFL